MTRSTPMPQSKKTKILFITPLASRTGSEMMLLYIVQRLDRSKYEIAVASYADGELLNEMPPDVRVYKVPGTFNKLDRINYFLGRHPIVTALKKIQREFGADFWYLNTIVLPKAGETAVELGVPFVVHFHEMPLSYVYVNRTEFELLIHKSVQQIGCSEATCQGIREAGGKNVSLVYSFIDWKERPKDLRQVAELKKKFGIKEDHFTWIMSGVPSERKGFDLFPEIADKLDDEKVHLMWVGGGAPDDGYMSWVTNRINSSTSKTKIHLAGRQKELYDQFLHLADGFVLTSRQDPFPLVMIEAATLGKPIVSFPSGGVVELVGEGMGAVTEDFSVRQLVTEMRKVMSGETPCLPEQSRARVNQYSIDRGMEMWNGVMDSLRNRL